MALSDKVLVIPLDQLVAQLMPYLKDVDVDSFYPAPSSSPSTASQVTTPILRPFSVIHKHIDKTGELWYLLQKNGYTKQEPTWESSEDIEEEQIDEYEEWLRKNSAKGGSSNDESDEDDSDDDHEAEQQESEAEEDERHKELLTYEDHFGGVPEVEVDFREINWRCSSEHSIPQPAFLDCQPAVSPKSFQPLKRRKIRLDSKQSETIEWAQ